MVPRINLNIKIGILVGTEIFLGQCLDDSVSETIHLASASKSNSAKEITPHS